MSFINALISISSINPRTSIASCKLFNSIFLNAVVDFPFLYFPSALFKKEVYRTLVFSLASIHSLVITSPVSSSRCHLKENPYLTCLYCPNASSSNSISKKYSSFSIMVHKGIPFTQDIIVRLTFLGA